MTTEQKKFWTGMGVGFAVGGVICGATCFCVSKKVEHKKYEERLRQDRSHIYAQGKQTGYTEGYSVGVRESKDASPEAVKAAYMQGVDDATLEAQKWIDEHMIQVDSDNPEDIQKAIKEQKRKNEAEKDKNDAENRLSEEDYAVKDEKNDKNVNSNASEAKNDVIPPSPLEPKAFSGRRYMIQHIKSGTTLEYPIELFCDTNGFLDSVHIRNNLLEYEKDPKRLKMIWEAMNWGEYYPDEEIPSIETINNWDVSISNDEVTKMMDAAKDDPEPEERTIERERYLDRVEKYRNNPNAGIKYITYEDYSEESHLDHIQLDYYAGDNVFLQPDSDDRKLEDPVTDLGISNGQILFNENPYKEKDPDLVYIENFGQHFVAEITRYKGYSTGISDGSAYLNGETGIVGGASGV